MCCEGSYQDHLINRLDDEFTVCGIVRQRSDRIRQRIISRIKQHGNPANFIRHVLIRLKLRQYEIQAIAYIQERFKDNQRGVEKGVDIAQIFTTDINEPAVVSFIKLHKPDLICVNGTKLLRQPLLELIDSVEFGIINLHTGLSPYARGGNCNLYMLLERKPELVGITVHHIDKGIDSGDIIISCRPRFKPDDNYETIDARCFYIGCEAMVQACEQLFSGRSLRIKQWQSGKLFLKRTGYIYEPSQRLEANKLIENGLLMDYLENRGEVDQDIRTIGRFDYPDD